ncbi:MAG: di-heme oxidoredictase family protein [Caldilineaceae bacterium]
MAHFNFSAITYTLKLLLIAGILFLGLNSATNFAESAAMAPAPLAPLGQELAIPRHLHDGEEFQLPLAALLAHGERLFSAHWTSQEGAGRPLTKGTGVLLSKPSDPLVFPRNFNRVSGPDANGCISCHNLPYGIAGGSGDFVANVFVMGQRFDFATFSTDDPIPVYAGINERGEPATLETIGNFRASVGMFGSGYMELLARQMTADLQQIRDSLAPGEAAQLTAKGVDFGILRREADGRWDTSAVTGLAARSLASEGPLTPPDLIIRPFHQSGTVISLREFTNSAFNHHHGIQSTERFGRTHDADGDGFVDELTRADVTAVVLYQATMAVPGRVIPNHPEIEAAVWAGEQTFERIGCSSCHITSLPLIDEGWIFTEPNPFNPAQNLRPGDAPALAVDLSELTLPGPRLPVEANVVHVPAYTDLKLHNITSGPDDANVEPLDLNRSSTPDTLFAGNAYFLTARLWGVANQPPYFQHGKFTTMREAILAHAGEAEATRQAFAALDPDAQATVIEFLKSLQVLPPGAQHLIVDEEGHPKVWPPRNS